MKLLTSFVSLAVLSAIGSSATPARADWSIDLSLSNGRDRPGCVEPVYETRCERVWVAPVYETRVQRVWHEPVVENRCERVWVPDQFEWREIRCEERGRIVIRRERVLVVPGHFEERQTQVVVQAGYFEDVATQVCVREGHWKTVERRVLVRQGYVVPPSYARRDIDVHIGRDDDHRDRRDSHDRYDRSNRFERDDRGRDRDQQRWGGRDGRSSRDRGERYRR